MIKTAANPGMSTKMGLLGFHQGQMIQWSCEGLGPAWKERPAHTARKELLTHSHADAANTHIPVHQHSSPGKEAVSWPDVWEAARIWVSHLQKSWSTAVEKTQCSHTFHKLNVRACLKLFISLIPSHLHRKTPLAAPVTTAGEDPQKCK